MLKHYGLLEDISYLVEKSKKKTKQYRLSLKIKKFINSII